MSNHRAYAQAIASREAAYDELVAIALAANPLRPAQEAQLAKMSAPKRAQWLQNRADAFRVKAHTDCIRAGLHS